MPGYVSAPPPPSGGFGTLIGALVFIDVHNFEPQAVTPFGIKDQAQVTIRVIDHPTDPAQNGQSTGTPITNVVLVGQLRNLVGQTALGRLVYGKQTQGNPPVKLDPPTPADEAKADQFLAGQGAGQPAAPAGQPAQAASQPQAAPYAGQPGQAPQGYPQAPYGGQTAPQGPPQGYPAPVPAYSPNGAPQGQPGGQFQPPPGYPQGQPDQPPF